MASDDLRARIAEAFREAGKLCDDDCADPAACDAAHPIQATVLHFDQVADIEGPVELLADVAAGVVEAELDRLRAQVAAVEAKAAEWEQLAPADDWGMTPSDTVLADAGRYLKALLIKAASQPSTHVCGNCEGIDPGTCLNNPDRTKES